LGKLERGELSLDRRPLVRLLLASAAIAAAMALAGCDPDHAPSVNGRHMQPLSDQMLAEIENKNMAKESAILVRIFKEESELEVWKENKTGRFALLRTYPICRWSGELGPKTQTGDHQAPEGFYSITPELMNPNSNYYLAINTGFPNTYDRANGRTGSFLMIHGDCLSVGCYAMTDEQIGEIYALAREAFLGGQESFQIQAYPFRMTPLNMARHRDSPHMTFWKMLKQGYDHFEVTHLAPKVDVCEKRYVFDAATSAAFSPADRCPAYKVRDDIAAAVRDKQRRDDALTGKLISRGTPTAPVTAEGGMHPTFLAAIRHSGAGAPIHTAAGTIPSRVNPPSETSMGSTMSLASTESRPAPWSMQVASAAPGSWGGGPRPADASAPKSKAAAPVVAAKPVQTATARPQAAETKTANAVAPKPHPAPRKREESAELESAPARTTSLLNGAQPTMPSGGFDNRFAAARQPGQ
jgi:murein L,D-transpeptidase YafK